MKKEKILFLIAVVMVTAMAMAGCHDAEGRKGGAGYAGSSTRIENNYRVVIKNNSSYVVLIKISSPDIITCKYCLPSFLRWPGESVDERFSVYNTTDPSPWMVVDVFFFRNHGDKDIFAWDQKYIHYSGGVAKWVISDNDIQPM